MAVTVKFFAGLKEKAGVDQMRLDAQFEPMTVAGLRAHLLSTQPDLARAFEDERRLNVAVNQELAQDDTEIDDGSEVAFFPPVTGG